MTARLSLRQVSRLWCIPMPNQQLARNILARQIVARIRFRVAHPMRVADQRAERRRRVEGIE